jgi:hypothetical protein
MGKDDVVYMLFKLNKEGKRPLFVMREMNLEDVMEVQ